MEGLYFVGSRSTSQRAGIRQGGSIKSGSGYHFGLGPSADIYQEILSQIEPFLPLKYKNADAAR